MKSCHSILRFSQIFSMICVRSHGFSYQFLGEAWWGPVICNCVERWVFTWDHWVGDDHAVTFIDPCAVSSLNLSCEMGISGLCQQSSDLAVILCIRVGYMLLLTAVALYASFSAKIKVIFRFIRHCTSHISTAEAETATHQIIIYLKTQTCI